MPEKTDVRFEDALNQIEEIVASLERGEPDLAVALAKYENGVRLLTRCYGLLDRAERSVEILTGLDAEGNPLTAPFDATATIELEKAMKNAAADNTAMDASASASPPGSTAAPKPTRSRRAKPVVEPEPEADRFDPPF